MVRVFLFRRHLVAKAGDLAPELLALLRLADRQKHLIPIERLGQVVVRPALHGVYRQLHTAVGGHHDHKAAATLAAVALYELEAIHVRHPDIAKDDVGSVIERLGQTFPSIRRRAHVVTGILEDQRNGPTNPSLVIDDENLHPPASSDSIRSVSMAGSEIAKTAPPSARPEASICPCMPSMSRAETAKPNPVP